MTITWRPARIEDAPAIAASVNAGLHLAGSHEPISEQSRREELTRSFGNLDTDTIVAEIDGSVAAFGGVIAPAPGATAARAQASVHPAHRGRGVGTRLLSRLIERTRAMRAASGDVEPWLLRHGSEDGDPSTGELLAAHGFRPVRFSLTMARNLADVALPAAIDGLELRQVRPADTEALYDAHRTAFTDHWGSQDRGLESFVSRVSGAAAFRPELSRIAVDGAGTVAGYALAFVEADPSVLLFALIGTRREWRGRGVASELVRRSLDAARAAGLASASLHVDGESPTGAVGVYERLGFRVIGRSTAYALELV